MGNYIKGVILFLSVTLLSGCVSPEVALQQSFWKNKDQKIIVATATTDGAELYQAGDEGLLDVAINGGVTSQFNRYLQNYTMDWMRVMQIEFIARLASNNMNAKAYFTPIDLRTLTATNGNYSKIASKNFMPLRVALGNNKMLLISINEYGAVRDYYAFIPLDAPKAVCNIEGRLVDLTNNRILWRHKESKVLAVEGDWDQPPRYGNFTKALVKVTSSCAKSLVDSFMSSAV